MLRCGCRGNGVIDWMIIFCPPNQNSRVLCLRKKFFLSVLIKHTIFNQSVVFIRNLIVHQDAWRTLSVNYLCQIKSLLRWLNLTPGTMLLRLMNHHVWTKWSGRKHGRRHEIFSLFAGWDQKRPCFYELWVMKQLLHYQYSMFHLLLCPYDDRFEENVHLYIEKWLFTVWAAMLE